MMFMQYMNDVTYLIDSYEKQIEIKRVFVDNLLNVNLGPNN